MGSSQREEEPESYLLLPHYFGRNQDRTQLTMLIKMDPSTAPQKPLTWNPGTRTATSASKRPLMISRKSPRVRTVRGSVRKTIIGRMIALIIPKTKAVTKAAQNPSTRITLGKR